MYGCSECRDVPRIPDKVNFTAITLKGLQRRNGQNMLAGLATICFRSYIRIAGRSVANLHPSKRYIAMVFQSYALYPNMSVADNIGFGMETPGVAKNDSDAAERAFQPPGSLYEQLLFCFHSFASESRTS